ncbi:hypothetical protein [Streptomyces cyaneofuscatus]|uniref:hypothetical protein n=1 Tax=Streptomyces cyaneofuscatus TaxID=66883 RepID=UPI003657C488
MDTRVQTRVSAYAVAVEDGRLLLARLSDASPIFTPGLFYAVDLKAGAPVVGETDGSTDAAVWTPLADLQDSLLSPAAADALRLLAPSP